jgi:hypothetical protein
LQLIFSKIMREHYLCATHTPLLRGAEPQTQICPLLCSSCPVCKAQKCNSTQDLACLVCCLALKMEVVLCSETPVNFYQNNRCNIPEIVTAIRSSNLIRGVCCPPSHKQKTKQTPWSESASELYRPSDRRLSAK